MSELTDNDTTRDELRERVKTYLADFQDTTGYDNHDMNALGDTYAQSIIALVTAARDAEIREALESEELVGMFARMLWAQGDKPTAAPSSSYYMAARYNLDGIAKHIGLGDETGGQG